MRYIHTFWSGTSNPMFGSYGWKSSEYNLMSWALSCYSLRRLSDDVALYTDKKGYELLVSKLQLPYTEVNVVYDENLCLPQHWAYAKIKTYSLQTKPFVHVDGDVYLCEALPEIVLSSSVIVQNREIGTGYYRNMMDRILACKNIILPTYIREALENESISSYNMGFFGGNDLRFIKFYCEEVFRFMESNRMNDLDNPSAKVDCNVFFEQVFLAALADREGIHVSDVLGRSMYDEGYGFKEFCNLTHYGEQPFFHILGGHKKNSYICRLLEQTLWRRCPEYIWKIYNLFPWKHARLVASGQYSAPAMSVERSLACYEDFLSSTFLNWSHLNPLDLYKAEKASWMQYEQFFVSTKEEKNGCWISANPFVVGFVPPVQWNAGATTLLREKLVAKDLIGFRIFVLPCLENNGVKEVAVGDLGNNILVLLEDGQLQVKVLKNRLKRYFDSNVFEEKDVDNLINREILYLLSNNIINLNFFQ